MTSISPGHRDIQGVFFYLNKFHAVPSPMAQLRLTIEIGMSKISCLDGLGVAPSAQTLMHPINYFAVLTQVGTILSSCCLLQILPLAISVSQSHGRQQLRLQWALSSIVYDIICGLLLFGAAIAIVPDSEVSSGPTVHSSFMDLPEK
eukprot:scaffold76573_cov16-Tisochrysis_lutea.AAC.2